MGKAKLFDLEGNYAFYEAYHTSPVNVMIHFLFVWPMFFTFVLLLCFTPPLLNIPSFALFNQSLALNFGFFFALIFALLYIRLDYKAGTLAALLCLGCWGLNNYLAKQMGFSLALKVFLGVQIFCWTTQAIGHGIFEERKPDVADNFLQALFVAPFCIFLEALQKLFGYEPYPGFNTNVKAKIEIEIKDWELKMQKKSS